MSPVLANAATASSSISESRFAGTEAAAAAWEAVSPGFTVAPHSVMPKWALAAGLIIFGAQRGS
jgi:hypothetical protein